MIPLGDPARHVQLVHGMARATGVDPVAAAADGRLSQDDWADLIRLCRGCGWAEDCTAWLARGERADTAPPACLNRARLAALQADE